MKQKNRTINDNHNSVPLLAIESATKSGSLITIGLGKRLESATWKPGIWQDWSRRSIWPKSGLVCRRVRRCSAVTRPGGRFGCTATADAGGPNLVVDSASIEVNRRKRRAKTDRMDVGKLLTMLMRYHQGEKKVWRCACSQPGNEDQRQLHRDLMALKAEQTHHINR